MVNQIPSIASMYLYVKIFFLKLYVKIFLQSFAHDIHGNFRID
jgi:hypothetical protein